MLFFAYLYQEGLLVITEEGKEELDPAAELPLPTILMVGKPHNQDCRIKDSRGSRNGDKYCLIALWLQVGYDAHTIISLDCDLGTSSFDNVLLRILLG